jgi:hypothetical protein
VEQECTSWEATGQNGRAEALLKKRPLNFCCVYRGIQRDPITFHSLIVVLSIAAIGCRIVILVPSIVVSVEGSVGSQFRSF